MLDVRIVRVLVSQHLVPMRVHVGPFHGNGASGQSANERSTPKSGATEKWTWTSVSTSVLTVRPRQGH